MKFFFALPLFVLSFSAHAGVLVDRFDSTRQMNAQCSGGLCGEVLNQRCDSLILTSTKTKSASFYQVTVEVLDDASSIEEFQNSVCSSDGVNFSDEFSPVVETPLFAAFGFAVLAKFAHGHALVCGGLVGTAVSAVYLLPRALIRTALSYAQGVTTFESDLNKAMIHLLNRNNSEKLKISTALYNAIEEGIRKASIEEQESKSNI